MGSDCVVDHGQKVGSPSDRATHAPDDSRVRDERQEAVKQARKSIVHASRHVRILLRRPRTDQVAHEDPEIESGHVHEQSFEDVRMMPQMRSSHASRFQVVREWTLQEFTASAK